MRREFFDAEVTITAYVQTRYEFVVDLDGRLVKFDPFVSGHIPEEDDPESWVGKRLRLDGAWWHTYTNPHCLLSLGLEVLS
jgi:hypothetical protein